MGGLSNIPSWVSEEREREIPIGKSKGTKKGETYSQSGSSEAPQSLVWWVFFVLFCFPLVMRPGVCCPEPTEPALCGQPGSEPAGRWMAWGIRRQKPRWRRAKFGPGHRPAPVLTCGGWMRGAEACPCGDPRNHEPLEHQGERSALLPGAL